MLPNRLSPERMGGAFLQFKRDVASGKKCVVFGASRYARRHLAWCTGGFVMYLTADSVSAREVADTLSDYYGGKTAYIPERQDTLVNAKINFSDNAAERAKALAEILTGDAVAAAVGAEAFLDWYPSRKLFESAVKVIKTGDEISPETLEDLLVAGGYKRTDEVGKEGEFSKRGDVFDVWCPTTELPARLDFFGDTVESIRLFAPDTMLSVREIKKLTVSPKSDMLLSPGGVKRVSEALKEEKRRAYRELGQIIEEQLVKLECDPSDPTLGWSIPFIDEKDTLADYIPEGGTLIIDDPRAVFDKITYLLSAHSNRVGALKEAGAVTSAHRDSMVSKEIFLERVRSVKKLAAFQTLASLNPVFSPDSLISVKSVALPQYTLNFEALYSDVCNASVAKRQTMIYAGDDGAAKTLADFFRERGSAAKITENEDDDYPLLIIPRRVKRGFSYPDAKILVIGTDDVLKKSAAVKRAASGRKRFVTPEKGDYVVHVHHGIGVYDGMQTLTTSLGTREYFCILYKGGDKLYLPTDRLDEVEKYTGGGKPAVHRLDSRDFERVKERVKASVKAMAIDLRTLYEKRMNARGHVYSADTVWQKELEDAFPFTPTDDQLIAVSEIKRDMESGKVMDRLLVGDVGFGKTEVAVRAIFKTIIEGKQAAVLAPTTILANQHFNTISERFKPFGIKIDILSRLVSRKELNEALKRIKSGETSVVVATHRLLGKDVVFNDLGLLVLDEEQRFGVEHKEKLKALKNNVNVLSMSATPIPRTLHMALSGIRDISTLETPPAGRLPVETYVVELTDALIKDVCLRETARGGQVYILYNRVQGIERFYREVCDLLGEGVRVIYAHGQMTPQELNGKIRAFYDKEADVLIATAIIENGIDIPDANSLIVVDADRFGLAELYQLRGRVGRSLNLAYAYFTVREGKVMTENAEKRLEALSQLTELGSGFRVAMRDLEIRGAGSVLGKEQHGNMEKVGYDMYVKLLKESVEELKTGKSVSDGYSEVVMEVEGDAELDRDYISAPAARVEFYKRAAALESPKETEDFLNETADVYGKPPASVKLLAEIGLAKNLAKKLNISKVVSTAKGSGLWFSDSSVYKDERIFAALDAFRNDAVLSPKAPPVVVFRGGGAEKGERFGKILEFLIKAAL